MTELLLVKDGSNASRILDLLRFLSAVTVFLFHFYVPLPGNQAVMVFFVLSGYFISSTVLKSTFRNKWIWSDYILQRITRLWIVLLPALILTFLWGKTQLGLFGEEISPPNLRISDYLSWKFFFGNLFFTQGILVKPFGLNGPLWSLSYEFWYYMLFPCLVLTFYSKEKAKKIVCAVIFIGISLFVGQKIMEYFLIWLLGAMVPLLKPMKIKIQSLKNIMLLLFMCLVAISMNYKAGTGFLLDLRVGVVCALLVYLTVSCFNENKISKYNIPKYLAGFSYTLYLVHYPLANFILTWRVSTLWPFNGNSLIIKMTLALIVFAYAWLIGALTEKHTDQVRKFLANRIFNRKPRIVENIEYLRS